MSPRRRESGPAAGETARKLDTDQSASSVQILPPDADNAHVEAIPSLCPDCGQRCVDLKLVHLDTCPIGRSIEESQRADREFFAAHPNAREYRRPLAACDIDGLRRAWLLPEGYRMVGLVLVIQIGPGVRGRDYAGILAVPYGGEQR